MRALLLFMLPAVAATALVLSCGETEEDLPDGAELSLTPEVTTTATPAASPEPAPTLAAEATATPAATPIRLIALPEGWTESTDPELGFTVAYPDGLTREEEVVELPGIGQVPRTEMRQIRYLRRDGTPVLGVSTTLNPSGAALEEWIRTVPGWPCEPGAYPTCEPEWLIVAGEPAVRFSINVLGDPAATVYFAHRGAIYVLGGNLYGSQQYEPALTEDEFAVVLGRFRFEEPE
jgi:hypothetical protein